MSFKFKTTAIVKCFAGFFILWFIIALTRLYLDQPTSVYFNGDFSKSAKTYLDNTPIVLPSKICEGGNFIVTFVTSAPNHFELRHAIRKTWGSIKDITGYNIETYFILGTTSNKNVESMVQDEYRKYDDIVLEDFVDSYYNLTMKSLMILKTVNNHCLDTAKYVLKVDDDVFVNFPLLIENLAPYAEREYLFMGSKFTDGTVDRIPWSKWYAPTHIYNGTKYPPMLYGSAYIFSSNIVPKLIQASLDIPLYHLEDVYITGFLSHKLDITLTHNPQIERLKVESTPCKYVNLTTSHYNVAEDYQKLFQMLYSGVDLETQCKAYKSTLANFLLRFSYM